MISTPLHRRALRGLLPAALVLVALAACGGGGAGGGDTIDVQVFVARLDEHPADPPPSGWQRVTFAGSERSRAGSYLVAAEPLLTGWNLTAIRAAEEPDGSRAITARLNAAARERLEAFGADEDNLRLPLGVRVDGRWADFSPLLRPPGDRLSLFGFTADEADRLERWLDVR